jgi:hypothetical protein
MEDFYGHALAKILMKRLVHRPHSTVRDEPLDSISLLDYLTDQAIGQRGSRRHQSASPKMVVLQT